MKLRKNFLVLMAVSCMALSLSGCGHSSDNKKATEITTVENTVGETTTETSEQASDFDFSQVFDHVEVNGKHIPFPFTLNDLGDGFEVSSVTEMGDGNSGGTLYYNDEMVAVVFMHIEDKNKLSNDTQIYRIDLSNSDTQIFKISGINCDNNVDDIKNNIIGLDDLYDENNKIILLDKRKDNMTYITLYVNENESIRSIYLSKGE